MNKNKFIKVTIFLFLVLLFTFLFSLIGIKSNKKVNTININKEGYIIQDTLAYLDISNYNTEYYEEIIYLGTIINILEESNNIYKIEYNNKHLYVNKNFISYENPLEEQETIYFNTEIIDVYKYPSTLSEKILSLEKYEKIDIVGKIQNFYKINIDDNFYYIKEDYLFSYEEIFKECEKDIYILEDLYGYTSPSMKIKLIQLKKGMKVRIIEESEDFLVFKYNNRLSYIEKSDNIIDAVKVFIKSDDQVITTTKTKIYSSMNNEGQFLLEVPKDTAFKRIYYGTKGYDIILLNDNTLGYAMSEAIEPLSNIVLDFRKTGYLKETTNLYEDSTLTTTNELILSGTRLYIIHEINGYSRVTDGIKTGYIDSKLIVSSDEASFITNVIKYTNTDISFNYIENNKEFSEIIPKGMFVLQKETSNSGIDKIEYNGHIGTVNSSYLSDFCEVSPYENFMSYKSDTLEIKITRYNENGSVYWISEVKTNDASKQLKCGLSHGDYGGKRQKTSEQVSDNKGILGINGSGFWYEDGTIYGNIVIKNSKVIKDGYGEHHLMCIDKNGKIFSAPDPSDANDLLKLGVTNTFGFGPMLIIDGKDVHDTDNGAYPRTGIGMIKPGHYIIITADGKRPKTYSKGLSIKKLTNLFKEYDVEYAYNLDGGGSVTLTFLNEVVNIPSDGSERPCADTIYFID